MTITQQQAVKICPVNDAACGELPPSVRCAECKQSTAQPQAVVPALTNEQIAAGYLAMLSSIEVVGMDRAVQRFRDAVAAAQPSAQAERAPVQAGEFMPLHAGNGNRHGPLSAACDNVLAWRLGEACNAGAKASAGDLIDRGLVLLRELRERGFLVVQATDADRASSGATTPAAPFAKDSWQHAVDNQLVAFGRTSQEFANPHEALSWLAIMNMELGQSNAGATTQAVRFMTREEIAECCNGLMRDNSAIETWIRRAITKAFAVNGLRIPADGVIGGV